MTALFHVKKMELAKKIKKKAEKGKDYAALRMQRVGGRFNSITTQTEAIRQL